MDKQNGAMPSEDDIRMADEFLRLRGSSLKNAIRLIIEAIPEDPLCLCFKGMRFKQEVLDAMREAEEHPERMFVCNSIEDYLEQMRRL